jgi:nitrogen fixation-related uncharacterized protein
LIAMSMQNVIGLIWLGYCALATTVVAAFFTWAIRSGQFKHQDHARYLPLEAGDLNEEDF